jgi:hypothetical protein
VRSTLRECCAACSKEGSAEFYKYDGDWLMLGRRLHCFEGAKWGPPLVAARNL